MSVTVGTLVIDLKANTASFSGEMSKMSQLSAKTANDIKRSLEKVAAAGLAMGAAIATGTVAVIKGAIDQADALGKLAQSTGTTVETLSTLSYAAKLSGVQTDQLGVGLVRLSKAAFAAQNGNIQLERIFSRMGITVADSNGHLKDSGVLMEQLAVKFSKTADGAGKTAISTALLGKSGAALIPFMNEYGASQARINAEAQRFGMALTTNTVQLAGQAKESIETMKERFEGLGFAILSTTLPGLIKLSDQILKVADDAHLPDLARAFGEKVGTAVTFLGNALEFTEKHAHALKIALEGLAALKLGTIVLPVIGDLTTKGASIEKIGKGLDQATRGLLGLERTLPVLARFGAWVSGISTTLASLARTEGIAATASFAWTSGIEALNGALGTTAGLLGVVTAGAAIFGIALVSEKFAAEKLAGAAVTWGDMWHAAMQNVIDDGRVLLDILKFDLPKAIRDLSNFQSLRTRAAEEAKKRPVDKSEAPPPPPGRHKPPPDTSGMGAPKKDIYGDEIRQLDQAIAAQRAYLSVLDAEPSKMREVEMAEKARAEILKLNNSYADEGRPKLTAAQEAILTQKIATEESTKALVDYGKGIVEQQRSTDLAIRQAKALAAANLEGAAAIQRVTVANAILALNQKGQDLGLDTSSMAGELAKLTSGLTAKSNVDIVEGANKEIYNLQQELATRRMLTAATLDSVDAQRQADLAAKLYSLDQQIAATTDAAALKALEAKRRAMVNLAAAENAQADAQEALALRSPTDVYEKEMDSLQHAVNALETLQGGTLTYGEQLQIAAKQQEDFNKATDATIELLLKEGSLGDGVTAFFLKMQEQAKTAAQTIFDVLNSTFDKLNDNLTALITAPNRWSRQKVENQFAGTFEDAGKSLLNNTIKGQEQKGLGALGKAMGINLGGEASKLGSRSNPMWVQWAGIGGSSGASSGGGAAAPAGMNPIFDGFSSLKSKFFGAPNELASINGSGSGLAPSAVRAGGNELDDLLGSPSSSSVTPSTAPPLAQFASTMGSVAQSQRGQAGVFGGILSSIGKFFGAKPTGVQPAGVQQPGMAAGALTSIGKLFGIQPKPASAQIPASTAAFLSSNELTDAYGSPGTQGAATAAPIAKPAGANELDNLTGPAVPAGTPGGATALSSLASIPAALQGNTGSTVLPQTSLFPPTSTNPLSGASNPFASSGTGLTPGESSIPSASAAQPAIYSQTVKEPPSTFDKLLAAGVQIAGIIGGAAAKQFLTPDSDSSSGSTSGLNYGSDPTDNTPDGAVTIPMASGGHVFGAGTSTSDSIPARLSHGEYVINADATAKHLPLLHAINGGFRLGGRVGFDSGGFVSPSAAYMPASSGFGAMSGAGATAASSASRTSGDTHNWTINIPPGNPDPAQMTAHLDRYMRAAAPKIAAMSVQAVQDQARRRAPSAK